MLLVLYSQVSQHSSLPISLVITIFCNTDHAKSKSYFYLIHFAIPPAGIIINKRLQFLVGELAVLRLHYHKRGIFKPYRECLTTFFKYQRFTIAIGRIIFRLTYLESLYIANNIDTPASSLSAGI